jgi:hypothetical protein
VRVHEIETTAGPVAVAGRTINLVARTSALTAGDAPVRVLGLWCRPAHAEVLDADGRRTLVAVHDIQVIATALIAATTAICLTGRGIARAVATRNRR